MIILASGSERRKEILKNLGYRFKVVPSSYTEDSHLHSSPEKLAVHHARGKALDVAHKHSGTILAFDTFVAHKNKIIGKPRDSEDAVRILKELSGTTHDVITGFCIIHKGKTYTDSETTKVRFRNISRQEILDYVSSEEVLDKAGAYAIQSRAYRFVEEIKGDYYNVVGFPVFMFIKYINKLKI